MSVSDTPRRDEAEKFWNSYDLPFSFDIAIKGRRSGLTRASNGTGRSSSTVEHLYVYESFTDGRLSRDSDMYLCGDDASFRFDGERFNDQNGEKYMPPVTCSRCLGLMERWETDAETETDADTDIDTMSEQITLEELLTDGNVEWIIFNNEDGNEETRFDELGEAVDTVIDDAGKEVGLRQATEVIGMSKPVYITVDGVVEELLNNANQENEDKDIHENEYVVDIRFAIEGLSASVYGENNRVVDETWFTWSEVETLKSDEASHVTFELPKTTVNVDNGADDDHVTVKRDLIESTIDSIECNMLTNTGEQNAAVRQMKEALNE